MIYVVVNWHVSLRDNVPNHQTPSIYILQKLENFVLLNGIDSEAFGMHCEDFVMKYDCPCSSRVLINGNYGNYMELYYIEIFTIE